MQLDFSDKRVVAAVITAGIVGVVIVIVLQVFILMGRSSSSEQTWKAGGSEIRCASGEVWLAEKNQCGPKFPRCPYQMVPENGRCVPL
jgi:hypothetical protein